MLLFDLLIGILGRLFGSFVDGEIESADTTAADLLVRFSVAAGVLVVALWLFVRFVA